MNVKDFRMQVVRPTLKHLDVWTQASENLLVGTAVQESNLDYLVQMGGGPALGVFQMEPATHKDIWRYLSEINPTLGEALKPLSAAWPVNDQQLVTNLSYATAIARVRFWMVPDPLPGADDIEGLAQYWKTHYNTYLGAGKPEEWSEKYRRYCEF